MSDFGSHDVRCPRIMETFLRYTDLPYELRHLILDAAVVARDVNINFIGWSSFRLSQSSTWLPMHGTTQVPALLHTHRESREHILKFYSLFHDRNGEVLPYGYFNFNLDRLSLGVKTDEEWTLFAKSLSPIICQEEIDYPPSSELEAFITQVNDGERFKIHRIMFQRSERWVGPGREKVTRYQFPSLESMRILAKIGSPNGMTKPTALNHLRTFKKTFLDGTRQVDISGPMSDIWTWKVMKWVSTDIGEIMEPASAPDLTDVRSWWSMTWSLD